MPEAKLYVTMLSYTAAPVTNVARASKLCYSANHISELDNEIAGQGEEEYLNKLISFGHLSPIEHASFTFGVEGVSRALLAQITRHRIASFSVQSQRYVATDTLEYIVPPSIRALGENAVARYEEQMRTINGWYLEWLDLTDKAEDARFVLPNAAATRMIVTMNARELMHFFALRCCNRAQWEIRKLAWAMLGLCKLAAPALFRAAGSSCIGGACSEGRMSCNEAAAMRKKARELEALLGKDNITEQEILFWAIQNA
ncbi:MAG: FAD-dependent thymidylate synthase [Bacillota bacterium]